MDIDSMEFVAFQKIPRWSRGIVVTEKIDGTNAQILIPEDPAAPIIAGSRTRYITPENDNYGFARWVAERAEKLRGLGPGRHFGEWWGAGIQRRYGVPDKRLSLFNAGRWNAEHLAEAGLTGIVGIVPVLYAGPMSEEAICAALERLRVEGSNAAPGFMDPEGVVVYHSASGSLFKRTLKNDESPKGAQEAA